MVALAASAAVAVFAGVALRTEAAVVEPRPFTADSYWNKPMPANAPIHPNNAGIINFLRADNPGNGCVQFSSADVSNDWGMPFYIAKSGDPEYTVNSGPWGSQKLRIPVGAQPMPTSDGEMVVIDKERNTVVELYHARFVNGTWASDGGSFAAYDSNGLDRRVTGGDPRNDSGFRGYPGSVAGVRVDEVAGGEIAHRMKIGVNEANAGWTWPMWESDGDLTDPNAPKQGVVLRIKPSVNLDAIAFPHPYLKVIAKNAQTYGLMVADSSSVVELKLENTEAEGRGDLWPFGQTAMCGIGLDMSTSVWEVIAEGYNPPAGGSTPTTAAPTTVAPTTTVQPTTTTVAPTTTTVAPSTTTTQPPANGNGLQRLLADQARRRAELEARFRAELDAFTG